MQFSQIGNFDKNSVAYNFFHNEMQSTRATVMIVNLNAGFHVFLLIRIVYYI